MLIEPEDDGEEHFVDAPEHGQSFSHAESSKGESSKNMYDGRKREPRFANADSSCLWELVCSYYLSDVSSANQEIDTIFKPFPSVRFSTSIAALTFLAIERITRHLP